MGGGKDGVVEARQHGGVGINSCVHACVLAAPDAQHTNQPPPGPSQAQSPSQAAIHSLGDVGVAHNKEAGHRLPGLLAVGGVPLEQRLQAQNREGGERLV